MFVGRWCTIKIHVPRNMDPRFMFCNLGSKIHSMSLDNLYKILSYDPIFLAKSFRKIRFSSLKVRFSSTAFSFLRHPRKSSSMAFRVLQRLSNFFTGYLLSETAFRILQRLSNVPQRLSTFWEIRENLSMVANTRKIAIRASYFPLKITIFCDKIIGSWNTNNRYQSFVFSASSFVILAN